MDRRAAMKRSVEARAFRRGLVTVSWVYGLLLAVTAVSFAVGFWKAPEYAWRSGLLYAVGFTLWYAPFAAYYFVNYFGLLRCAERCVLRVQALEEYRFGLFGTARFILTFPDGNGGTVRAETKAIYNTNMRRPRFEDYFQKEAAAVYDPATGRTAILEFSDLRAFERI